MKIAIFNPTKYFGGASVLLYRIFDQLKKTEIDVIAIDLLDGYMASNVGESNDALISISSLNTMISDHDLDNRVFVCTTTMVSSLKTFCKTNNIDPYLISWVVHPYEMSIEFIPRGGGDSISFWF